MESTVNRAQSKRARAWLLALLVALPVLLEGCQKESHPNDLPVSYWADPKNPKDSDPCVHATAQAIVKSGLPYPNFTTYATTGPSGKPEKRIETVDVWVGSTRFVLPGKIVGDNGMYANNHPMRYWRLVGSLPNFYPAGDPGPVVDGMGSMVEVTIHCSVDPAYVASRGKGYRSNEEGIAKVKAQYEKELRDDPRYPGTVTVSIRKDLGMTEVLLDREKEANNRRFWEASYWPITGELKSADGGVSRIGCMTRHDPQKRYGGVGWRCRSEIGLTPEATATIEIYVSQIQHMPAIYEQVKQLFAKAQQSSGK